MAIEQIGTYHLADNPDLFEVQRSNNFEFVVTDIDDLVRAGTRGDEAGSRIKNGQEMLRLSIISAFVPHFTPEVVAIKRGNSTLKYAGVPTFNNGTITFNDFIGARVKDILKAWQNLSYQVETEKVGSVDNPFFGKPYKRDCYLIEYTPDYRKVRTWRLYGCWISSLSEGAYSAEDGGKHQIDCTIEYDRAVIDTSEII